MKGPNPFAPWLDDSEALCGRKEEMRAFASFMQAASSMQTGALAFWGGPGSGKSALLRVLRGEAEKAGLAAPLVRAERNEGEADLCGKIADELPAPGGMPAARARDFEALSAGLGRAAKGGAVVFIDDIDRMRKPGAALKSLVAAARRGYGRRPVSFALSMTGEPSGGSEFLRPLALRPFGEHEARELVEKALKKGPPKMGEECLQSILSDSGGNPRLMKEICFTIYGRLRDNEKVITKGHYLAYLPQITGSLSREWFGRMYHETPHSERAVLAAIAGQEGGMHVSDVAKTLKKPLGPVTALVGRLLESGQIVRVDRGKYRVFARLYAKYVLQRA